MMAKELNELIVWLKANPSKASAAIGASTIRLLTAFFQRETGTQFAFVPYRGGPPAAQDLMAGQIDFSFLTPGFPAASASREHKSLCGDARHTVAASA